MKSQIWELNFRTKIKSRCDFIGRGCAALLEPKHMVSDVCLKRNSDHYAEKPNN